MKGRLARRERPFAGVIFDLDGTLTRPHAIDFGLIRRRIGMPEPGSILHWIEDHAGSAQEAEAMRDVVWDEEAKALDRMELGEGFGALAEILMDPRSTPQAAICTRNNGEALAAFDGLLRGAGHPSCDELFPVQIARDHHSQRLGRVLLNKPSPEPTHEIKHEWGLVGEYPLVEQDEGEVPRYPDLLFVGDSEDDLLAGRRAGTAAGWMDHGDKPVPQIATHTFKTLADCAWVVAGR